MREVPRIFSDEKRGGLRGRSHAILVHVSLAQLWEIFEGGTVQPDIKTNVFSGLRCQFSPRLHLVLYPYIVCNAMYTTPPRGHELSGPNVTIRGRYVRGDIQHTSVLHCKVEKNLTNRCQKWTKTPQHGGVPEGVISTVFYHNDTWQL